MKEISPQKLVIETRFKKKLKYNMSVAETGLTFSADYPEWKRNVHDLHVINSDDRRRVYLSSGKWFFDVDLPPNMDGEKKEFVSVWNKLNKWIDSSDFTRFGVRAWYAIEVDESFDAMVSRFHRRFHSESDHLTNAMGVGATITDTSYHVTIKLDDWKSTVAVGPMERDQWFSAVPYDRDISKEFREEIPARFVFVDLDFFKDENVLTDLSSQALDAFPKMRTIVKFLFNKYKA